MHLQDGHLASGAIEIHLIHEGVGLVGLDEGEKLVDSRLDLLELPVEDERRIEDDDGIGPNPNSTPGRQARRLPPLVS